jgi:hypothetical protein|tara:strand:- start:2136 stop:2894 length:759 start_codon:yes stop_codon:yes gene_type:complete
MAKDVEHLKGVIALAETHQAKLASALVTLESRIATLMATAPLKNGDLFDLTWAIKARVTLREVIEAEYLATVDDIIREYAVVAESGAAMLATYGQMAVLDSEVVSQLQRLTYKGFEDLGQQYLDVVAKEIYSNTLLGTPFAASVASIKESVEAGLGRYAKQSMHDGLMQFDSAINTKIALDSGVTEFKYYGPDDSKTRPFCERHVGKVYTKDEIMEEWSGSWAGKISGDPFLVRGGYNCRHRFRGFTDLEGL